MVFHLNELSLGVRYIVTDTGVKIQPLSRTEYYISCRKRHSNSNITRISINLDQLPSSVMKSMPVISPWTYKSKISSVATTPASSTSSSTTPLRKAGGIDLSNKENVSARLINNLSILGTKTPKAPVSPFRNQKGSFLLASF